MIFTHVMAQDWGETVKAEYYLVFNVYNALTWLAVPVFVMISGALFLNRDIPIHRLYSKYILRITTAFVFWSAVYAARSYIKEGDALKAAELFITGNYHLWFLPMIAGVYMVVPFMKKIADSEILTKYFLVLSLVFAFIVPQFTKLVPIAEKFSGNLYMFFVMGYTGYFLLGYVLDRMTVSRRLEHAIYIAGILGVCVSVIEPSDRISVNILCESAAVFVFFKKHFASEAALVRRLSRYSFGVYLVHVAVLNAAVKYFHLMTIAPAAGIPLIAVIVFVISLAVSSLLNKFPILNKYIV